MREESPALGRFIPPSGVHVNCEFVCRKPAPVASGFKWACDNACDHSCALCDEKRRKEGRIGRMAQGAIR